MRCMIGKTISRYTIQKKLGHGGMGTVYLAKDKKLERLVALKFLSQQVQQRPSFRTHLMEEAKAAAAVDHVYVCKIYEIEEVDGMTFLVLEYVQGQTLHERLRGDPLEAADVLRIASETAEALAEAHLRKVIHRDIKPLNIMLTQQGHVKVMDFGLARQPDTETGLTRPDGLFGTPSYMSPEQLKGKTADASSDIFALGLVFYEMVWGHNPFRRDTIEATIAAIVSEQIKPPPLPIAGLSPDFVRIVCRMVEKDPSARYPTMQDVWMDVTHIGRSRTGLAATKPEQQEKTVAVLPFTDLSPSHDQEYFCDGLVEELINVLMRVPGLRVASRTSSFRLKGQDFDIRDAAARLNVRAVLEGSVRRAGERLRVVVKLVDAETSYPIWSESYESRVSEVFEIQDSVAAAVSRRFEAPDPQSARSSKAAISFQAYDQYLIGRFAWNKRTEDHLRKSIEFYRKALALQPDYSAALAAVAEAYATLALYGAIPAAEARAEVIEAANKAIALDSKSAMARTALACIRAISEWNWKEAERGFNAAIEADPNYAVAHHWFANQLLVPLQRFEEARAHAKRALDLDPLPFIALTPGILFFFERRYVQAIAELERVVNTDPGFGMTHYFMGQVFSQLGQYDAALKALEMAESLTGRSPEVISMLGYTYARMGNLSKAGAMLDHLHSLAGQRYISPLLKAQVLTAMSRFDDACGAVEEAQRAGATDLIWLRVRPQFEPLREHPVFIAVCNRVGV